MSHKGTIAFFVPHLGCPRNCSFCNQRTISGQGQPPTAEEVTQVLTGALENLSEKALSTEIAFFGGSFTAVDSALQHSLLGAASRFCGGNKLAGIRFSTRPDYINKEILDSLQQYPIRHIELGAQSMEDSVLLANGRGHSSKDVVTATELIKSYGYGITLQMMTGLYTDTAEGSMATARKIATLQPNSVRIYPTITLANTELERLWRTGEYLPPTLEDTVALCAELLLFFEENRISVIRLGLHHSDGLQGDILAGPHHPALRELCVGTALINKAKNQIKRQGNTAGKSILVVSPQNISCLTGHNRYALRELEKERAFFVKADSALGYLEIRVES